MKASIIGILAESWQILLDSSFFMLAGLLIAGLLKVFLSTAFIARHLGRGRYWSVLKAALLGVPLPICSCGVLPAAVSLKKQGANKGAVTAFLISTPESGVDSMAVTYALLDPLMTVVRPVAAFVTALTGGFLENSISYDPARAGALPGENNGKKADSGAHTFAAVFDTMGNGDGDGWSDQCCPSHGPPQEQSGARPAGLMVGFARKLWAGLCFALTEVWGDIAVWFFAGVLLAGGITYLIPDEFMASWLGGGLGSMLVMLLFGIPLYICASASTPVAAALILKGVSPGVALVFLLVGPATNVTSLSVLFSVLGRKSTLRYLLVVALTAMAFGLGVDWLYQLLEISPQAVIGASTEAVPHGLQLAAAGLLLLFSIKPILAFVKIRLSRKKGHVYYQRNFPR
ncbi:SO_0444 family Cu/Zn efflux transporter [Desulfogranum mediterraneum]|uniref:SO_0444 family Cu/Zn efflux transporter n=1 Tax=Desulfogranum mediterraneum TaxID=160661 RepID=UPI0004099EDE|nr:SO_0444 family Cu/Zn efflux transporter [Desulfogranum mediterraneum]